MEVCIGPIRLAGSRPLPGFILAAWALSFSTKASKTDSSTKIRLVARQAWPQLKKRPIRTPAAAASRSASSSTMQGSLPPSSRVIFFSCSAALAITFLPVGVDPVRPILRISGWVTIASPVPVPRTTFTTPSGRPPSISAWMQASVDSGVVLEGLRTTQLPAAIDGATLFAARVSGKFQGTIAPVTPIGRRTTRPVSLVEARLTCSPWTLSARSANQAMLSAKRSASIFDSRSVLPCSLVRIGAISSTLVWACAAALWRILALSAGASFPQASWALAAALAARSTSSGPPAGTLSTTSPVAGFITS